METISIPVDKNTKGLIFDCDGPLADTMGFHMEAWNEAFSKFGKTCPEALEVQFVISRTTTDFAGSSTTTDPFSIFAP